MSHGERYVPILRGKAGEFIAVEHLSTTAKGQLTPLFELTPIDWDYDSGQPKSTIADHVHGFAKRVFTACGTATEALVDFRHCDGNLQFANGSNAVTHVLTEARGLGLRLIPVVGLQQTAEYSTAVLSAIQQDRRGLCLRIEATEAQRCVVHPQELQAFLDQFAVNPSDIDLVIDAGQLTASVVGAVQFGLVATLNAFPMLHQWRTLTLAAGSRPEDTTGVATNSIDLSERLEWALWRYVRPLAARTPDFGDYGSQSPGYSDFDIRNVFNTMVAKIWYTIDQQWMTVKGHVLRRFGYDQFHDLCQVLASRPEFSGAGFSWGDNYIAACAQRTVGKGNLTTWVSVSTNHHLTFVADQLATLSAPLATP